MHIVELVPNATYSYRKALWLPAVLPGLPVVGVVDVVEAVTKVTKKYHSRYAVAEDKSMSFGGQRVFKVSKPKTEEDPDAPYWPVLSKAGDSCQCRGFQKHDHCKHLEMLSALDKAGLLKDTAGVAVLELADPEAVLGEYQ